MHSGVCFFILIILSILISNKIDSHSITVYPAERCSAAMLFFIKIIPSKHSLSFIGYVM